MARCHRIGQKKEVKIYRLVTRNTYEREMFDRASLKLGLDKAVLQSMNTQQNARGKEAGGALTKKEVEDLLKKGAYGALMDDDTAGDKFCEEVRHFSLGHFLSLLFVDVVFILCQVHLISILSVLGPGAWMTMLNSVSIIFNE